MKPEISILTSSFNRKDLLLEKLKTLETQSLSPEHFEWLVFINGSDDSYEALSQVKTPIQLELIKQSPTSIGEARNVCAKKAQGRILYFSDDDCLLEKDTLEQHLEAQENGCVAVGGIRFVAESEERWNPQKVSFWNLNGANSSVPKAAFDQVGGFDSRIQGYGGEDLLLGYKLCKAGLPFHALPRVVVRHMGPNPMRGRDLKKAKSAGRNAAKIAQLYPELAYRLGVHPLLMGLKEVSFNSPLSLVLKRLNPESFAYEQAYFEGAKAERI